MVSIQLVLLPTIKVTLKVPPVKYTCVGFCAVDVPPSPNFQFQEVSVAFAEWVVKSVKVTVLPTHCGAVLLKLGVTLEITKVVVAVFAQLVPTPVVKVIV